MAILTQSGRAAIAASIKSQLLHLAWGTGVCEESITATQLQNEVGRRVADEVLFCTGDENGELLTPTGRFKASTEPTNNLYVRFTFDFTDAHDQTITELGVMVGTHINPELPKGQKYFIPQNIVNKGILLVIENTVPLIRTAATRETFTFVVTF